METIADYRNLATKTNGITQLNNETTITTTRKNRKY